MPIFGFQPPLNNLPVVRCTPNIPADGSAEILKLEHFAQIASETNPLASDKRFAQFSLSVTTSTSKRPQRPQHLALPPTSQHKHALLILLYHQPLSNSSPDSVLDTSLTERVNEGEEGCIADSASGYFDEFNSMSAPSNVQCYTSNAFTYIVA